MRDTCDRKATTSVTRDSALWALVTRVTRFVRRTSVTA